MVGWATWDDGGTAVGTDWSVYVVVEPYTSGRGVQYEATHDEATRRRRAKLQKMRLASLSAQREVERRGRVKKPDPSRMGPPVALYKTVRQIHGI